MRVVLIFTTVLSSMLLVLYAISIYDSYVNTPASNTSVIKLDEDYNRTTSELCKIYRKWQALPEINYDRTGIDEICKQLGQ